MSRETDRTGELLLRVAFQRRPLWPEQPASLLLGAASGLALVVAALALFAPDRHLV